MKCHNSSNYHKAVSNFSQGDRRIHFDGAVFCVRNGGYSAGFDEKNKVTIFNKKWYPANVNH